MITHTYWKLIVTMSIHHRARTLYRVFMMGFFSIYDKHFYANISCLVVFMVFRGKSTIFDKLWKRERIKTYWFDYLGPPKTQNLLNVTRLIEFFHLLPPSLETRNTHTRSDKIKRTRAVGQKSYFIISAKMLIGVVSWIRNELKTYLETTWTRSIRLLFWPRMHPSPNGSVQDDSSPRRERYLRRSYTAVTKC